jgi:arylsulfatase A-like enzyme
MTLNPPITVKCGFGGISLLLTAFLCVACATSETTKVVEPRPNVLFVIADDLGYGDLGVYGAEVDTPHLDRLAASGVQFTNFHTAATCSPSRSMLLTGVDNHRNGLGSMGEFLTPEQKGAAGYEGHLNDRVRTLAEWLAGAGYFTVFSGKWHLGMESTEWPASRGFSRSFALLDGSGDNWSDVGPAPILPHLTFTRNGAKVERPQGFSSELYVDELLGALEEKTNPAQPFLAVLSFQAVHWPHHAPQDVIDKYEQTYDAGWDAIRAARHTRMVERGLLDANVPRRPRDPNVPAWESLPAERRRLESRRMAAYAAMTDDMDREIGRVLGVLDEQGSLDNTIIVFVSDNGPDLSEPDLAPRARSWYADRYPDQSALNTGRPGSFPSYGRQWAQLGSVHLRHYKGSSGEGGMRVPFIISAPGQILGGRKTDAFAFATDVVPTLLELTGVEAQAGAEKNLDEQGLHSLDGRSFAAVLRGDRDRVYGPEDVTGYELMTGSALFQGDLKLVKALPPSGDGTWKLFNLQQDPGELEDLSQGEPEAFDRLMELYEGYVEEYGVIHMDPNFDIFKALTSETTEP